jgi:hypothetical protein
VSFEIDLHSVDGRAGPGARAEDQPDASASVRLARTRPNSCCGKARTCCVWSGDASNAKRSPAIRESSVTMLDVWGNGRVGTAQR